jgi:hypothetical protein
MMALVTFATKSNEIGEFIIAGILIAMVNLQWVPSGSLGSAILATISVSLAYLISEIATVFKWVRSYSSSPHEVLGSLAELSRGRACSTTKGALQECGWGSKQSLAALRAGGLKARALRQFVDRLPLSLALEAAEFVLVSRYLACLPSELLSALITGVKGRWGLGHGFIFSPVPVFGNSAEVL